MQKFSVTLGWSSSLRPLSLVRLLHDQLGYSVEKAEHLAHLLTPEFNAFVGTRWDTSDEAAEFVQAARECGAWASESSWDNSEREKRGRKP